MPQIAILDELDWQSYCRDLFAVDVPRGNVEVRLQAIQCPHLLIGELKVVYIGVLSDSSCSKGTSEHDCEANIACVE